MKNLKLGIGICTFNRRPIVQETLKRVREHTKYPYTLVIADDGSPDDTLAMLREEHAPYLTGGNRGIAWNKNRALFHLHEIEKCDVIILLEDDTFPVADHWEDVWIAAALRWGHANLAPHYWDVDYIKGEGSPDHPYVSRLLTGQCSVFSSHCLSFVGYLDTRFRGYGFEHVEHTFRIIRAGWGGVIRPDHDAPCAYLITSDVDVTCLDKGPDSSGVQRNGPIFDTIRHEMLYRAPWRNDAEMAIVYAEQSIYPLSAPIQRSNMAAQKWLLKSNEGFALTWESEAPFPAASQEKDPPHRLFAWVRGRNAVIGIRDSSCWLRIVSPDAVVQVDQIQQATRFQIRYPHAQDGMSFIHDGRYLCCDIGAGHRVSASRLELSDWETFHFDGFVVSDDT